MHDIDRKMVVLLVFAHPDDLVLSCAGTVSKLVNCGFNVYCLELTVGERSRSTHVSDRSKESSQCAAYLGYQLFQEVLPDGQLTFDAQLNSLVDRYLRELTPEVVITHYPQPLGFGHQDHVAVASAVVNCATRTSFVRSILYAEPVIQCSDFRPNLFVDITSNIDGKLHTIQMHSSELHKSYMSSEVVRIRARWWAFQAIPMLSDPIRYFEAFVLVKGIIETQCSP